jgi:predicted DNA-binding ribbon-helix-helix protein
MDRAKHNENILFEIRVTICSSVVSYRCQNLFFNVLMQITREENYTHPTLLQGKKKYNQHTYDEDSL